MENLKILHPTYEYWNLPSPPPLSYSNIKNKNDYTSTHQVGEALYKHKTYTAPHLASKDRNGKKMKKKTKKKSFFLLIL
jgi:hypothetical protein